jgi:hypothetical protein
MNLQSPIRKNSIENARRPRLLSVNLSNQIKRKLSNGQENSLTKLMNLYLDPQIIKEVNKTSPKLPRTNSNRSMSRFNLKTSEGSKRGSNKSLKLFKDRQELPNLVLSTSPNNRNSILYTNINTLSTEPNENNLDKNICLTEIAQENKPYSRSNFNGSANPLFNRSSTGVINSVFKKKKGNIEGNTIIRKNSIKFPKILMKNLNINTDENPQGITKGTNNFTDNKTDKEKEKQKEKEKEKEKELKTDLQKKRNEFIRPSMSSMASMRTDTNTHVDSVNNFGMDMSKMNEIKYFLNKNQNKDKNFEINFNQYEIKIVPDNRMANDKVEELYSEDDSNKDSENYDDANIISSNKQENTTKNNLATFANLKDKMSNKNLKKLEKRLSIRNFDDNMTSRNNNKNENMNIRNSPTKIVINRALSKTIVLQINNKDDMDNFNINLNKSPRDIKINFNTKNKEKESGIDNFTMTPFQDSSSENKNSDSSTEIIKNNKFKLLQRVVEVKDTQESEELTKEVEVKERKEFTPPEIIINGVEEEEVPIVETEIKEDQRIMKHGINLKAFNKNFMRQLSRISEISNYFSKENDSITNNSFESGSIVKSKRKQTQKEFLRDIRDNRENEELELKQNLQVINLKDDNNLKDSIQQIDEKDDENYLNESNRVDIQIISEDNGSYSNETINKKKQYKTSSSQSSKSPSSSSDSSQPRGPLRNIYRSAKSLRYIGIKDNIEEPFIPIMQLNSQRHPSDSELKFSRTQTLQNGLQFSILGTSTIKRNSKDDIHPNLNSKLNRMNDKMENLIKKEKNKYNEKVSKYINEKCEANLFQNFKIIKSKKKFSKFQLGVRDLILNDQFYNKRDQELIPESVKSSELLSLTVQTEYIDHLLNTYFDINTFNQLITKNVLETNLETAENNKITLIKNFQITDSEILFKNEKEISIKIIPPTKSSSDNLMTRSFISQEAKKYLYGQSPKAKDKNYSVAYFRLGINNLVYSNKFLNLDLPEKELTENNFLIKEKFNFNMKKDINDNIEIVLTNNVNRRKTLKNVNIMPRKSLLYTQMNNHLVIPEDGDNNLSEKDNMSINGENSN